MISACFRDIKPIEHELRPKGLGLGADRSAIKDLEPGKPQRPLKPGEERVKEEELVMGPGGCVQVQSGAHKDLYGKVQHIQHTSNFSILRTGSIGGGGLEQKLAETLRYNHL